MTTNDKQTKMNQGDTSLRHALPVAFFGVCFLYVLLVVEPTLIYHSPYSESWHNYSNSGRWLVFSSKRQGGLFTRPHFSYIDEAGNARKPFVLPQKDPEHYYKTLSRIVQRKDRMIEVNQPISGATKTYGAKTELEANDRE